MENPKILTHLTKVRSSLLLGMPWFGALTMRLGLVENSTIDTARTNGKELQYNPAFIEGLSFDEAKAVLAHETMHCALAHHARRGERDAKSWNIAGDYVINGILAENGFTLRDEWLHEDRFKGLTTDAIYGIVHHEREEAEANGEPDPFGEGDDPGGMGGVEDAPGEPDDSQPGEGAGQGDGKPDPNAPPTAQQGKATEEDLRKAENEWKVAALQAEQMVKACGGGVGDLARAVAEIKIPAVDWREELRHFFMEKSNDDTSWERPNRRFVSSGLYLPSPDGERLGEIVIGVDVSGSIGQEECDKFTAEVQEIIEVLRPAKVHVAYCSTRIHGEVDVYTPEDYPVEITPRGGGGTNFAPVFDYVEAEGIEPECLVYLTDLCINHFPEEPDYPVLWVATSGYRDHAGQAPFGDTIWID